MIREMDDPAPSRPGFPPRVPAEEIRRCFFEGDPGPSGPSQSDGRGERICDLAARTGIHRKTVHYHLRRDPRYQHYLDEERRRSRARARAGPVQRSRAQTRADHRARVQTGGPR